MFLTCALAGSSPRSSRSSPRARRASPPRASPSPTLRRVRAVVVRAVGGGRGLDLDDANAWVSRLRRRAEDIADARDDVDAAYRPLFASVSDASERPRAGVDAFRGAGGLDRWRGRGWRFDGVGGDETPFLLRHPTPDPLDGVGEVVLDALELSSDVLAVTAPSAAEASAEAGAIIAEQAELLELADAFSVAGGKQTQDLRPVRRVRVARGVPERQFMASVANANAFPVSIGVSEEAPSFDVPNFAAGVAAGAAAFARKAYEKAFDDAERPARELRAEIRRESDRENAGNATQKRTRVHVPPERAFGRARLGVVGRRQRKARANANANARDDVTPAPRRRIPRRRSRGRKARRGWGARGGGRGRDRGRGRGGGGGEGVGADGRRL